MRLGVIDVGSNTVHLLVVDAHVGAQPIPASLPQARASGSPSTSPTTAPSTMPAASRLAEFVAECLTVAEDQGVEDLMGFVTSAIREAPNGDDVLAAVKERTGVVLEVLSGEDEARLTFLAARRWFGWSAGTLLVADIGGGSLEIAQGMDEDPDISISLPLGAGRVTRDHLAGDPPGEAAVRAARKHVRATIARERARSPRPAAPTGWSAPPRRCVPSPGSREPPRAARACMPSATSSAPLSTRSCPGSRA